MEDKEGILKSIRYVMSENERRRIATIMYKRRKVDKDINNLIKNNKIIYFEDVEAIGVKHKLRVL